MNYRVPSLLLTLLFLLMVTIGSLQSRTVFACKMMDIVLYDCCCVGHKTDKDRVDPDCDEMLACGENACCDRSVEISIDKDTRQDLQLAKPVEIRSDVDPPQAIIVNASDIFASPYFAVDTVFRFRSIVSLSGSHTYLITQRLRI